MNTNELLRKYLPAVDKFLLGGLGCGLILLCILLTSFFFIWQNPPRARPTAAQTQLAVGGASTVTPGPTATPPIHLATSSVLPSATGVPGSTPISTPAASNYGNSSPTGHIVFTCYVNGVDQICLMNADGTGRKQLTSEGATSFYASLSPGGDTIYFVSRRAGSFDIYSMNLKGKGLKRLTKNIGNLYAPDRSSRDDRIVFTNDSGGKQQIWIMRSDGNNPHPISDGPEDIDPSWSPNGLFIAFASARTGQRQLYVMDRDGTEPRQVTNLPNMGGRSTWSPDGTRLAFYAGPAQDHNIYVINVDGTGLIQLTNGGDNLGPTWSPDGNWIAFTSFRDGNNEIYIVHPDGTGLMRLTNNTVSDWQPRWGN